MSGFALSGTRTIRLRAVDGAMEAVSSADRRESTWQDRLSSAARGIAPWLHSCIGRWDRKQRSASHMSTSIFLRHTLDPLTSNVCMGAPHAIRNTESRLVL